MIALDILKLQLDDFFERSKPQTISKTIKKEEFYFNKFLFELEHHLFDLKEEYKVNQNLNTGISSENILNSFSVKSTFFRSNDYALSFLVFLCMQEKNDAEELREMVDKYIEIIKEKLSFHDIVKTDTGATRCHTNLRFTLNELRKYGLIYSTTTINKNSSRSLLPTPLGYLIALYVSEPSGFKVGLHLPEYGNSSNMFVVSLYAALKFIKNNPEDFLNTLLKKFDGIKPLEIAIKSLFDEYYNNILEHIELTDEGIKVNEKELEEAIKTYYLSIVDQVELSLQLKDVFLGLSNSQLGDQVKK